MKGVSDLPEHWERPDEASSEVDLAPRSAPLDRARSRQLELTPEEKVARRRNRRWMVGVAVPSIAVLLAALLASRQAANNQPKGPAITAPAGYSVHKDGYFSYVVPAQWSNNGEFTDSTGDVDTSGRSGWAAEHIGYRTTPPVIGEAQPTSLKAFGLPQPEPYQLTGGHPVAVPGAAVAFSYRMTRPGFAATVINAWTDRYDVEIWLVVDAPAPVTARIIASLTA